MTFSLFDHPYFSSLLRHEAIAALFSAEAELAAMLRFEAALAEVEAELGVIPEDAAAAIVAAIKGFQPEEATLAADVRRDGLVGPGLVAALRGSMPEAHRAHLHFGATSQDMIDTGLVLRLRQVFAILKDDLQAVLEALDGLSARQGSARIMGRTRMQQALPITVADRVATWRAPLARQLDDLDALENRVLAVQFGGAVGTLDQLGERGPAIRAALAERLGLIDPARPWHAERDRIADFAGWLAKISGSLGKIGQDLALMAQNEVGEAVLASGGLSSAMPHKKNPVQAEILVTLGRFNAGHLASIHHAMISEGERSGAAWTLEWLTLPEMVAATAAALMIAKSSIDGLTITSGARDSVGEQE